MHAPRTIALGTDRLTLHEIDAVARRAAAVELTPEARRSMRRSFDFVRDLATSDVPVYGLTTGCGPLAGRAVDAAHRERFQRNLIRSHAVSLGSPLPVELVRAAMTVRAHVLARGRSGVDPTTVDVLVAMLNAGVHPLVRAVGSVGASGDLVELAQIALAVIGEGDVEVEGAIVPAAEALAAVGVAPVQPRHREGLALINGTACHTGAAAVLCARGDRVLAAARIAAAMGLEALRGHLEAFDPHLHELRGHAAQREVAAFVVRFMAESRLVRRGSAAACQDAYTLRCIPQLLGAVEAAAAEASGVVDQEIASVIDNPVFLADEQRVVHGGNFHGQPVAMAIDRWKVAMVELGVVSERRLARLLDPALNDGLPPFLVAQHPGVHSGFMGIQYCASSMAADNAVHATPASVQSVPTNANNQDVVSMGMVAARQALHVLENVERMVAIELLAAARALELRGVDDAGRGSTAALAALRRHVPPLLEDRPLRDDVDTACALIESGTLVTTVARAIGTSIRSR